MKIKEDNFFERVYEVVRKIPYGKVTSYGAIAKALGTGRSAKMVGWAMNACHGQHNIPAHRVVNRLGLLRGNTILKAPILWNNYWKAKAFKLSIIKLWISKNTFGNRIFK